MEKMTIEYEVSDEQVKKLKAMLPYFNQHSGGREWTVEELFQFVMEFSPAEAINARLDFVERSVVALSKTPAVGAAGGLEETEKN